MKQILFVDDNPCQLRQLREAFATMQPEWEMDFANSGAEALQRLKEQAFDAVVSDLSMPEMDGIELLTRVREELPSAVRIILWSTGERETALRLVGTAHRDLAKTCDVQILEEAIERAVALRDLLADERLRSLVGQMSALPSVPELYLQLLQELSHDDPSAERISEIVQRDPAMCAKMLRLANSAFFGLPAPITNPIEAVLYMGVDTIKGLVLSLQFFSLSNRTRLPEFSFEQLWQHSWGTGILARRMARRLQMELQASNEAFTAGLLHDAGKLLLATSLTAEYRKILQLQQGEHLPLEQAERLALGTSHAEVGAYLLALWGLPDSIVEAVGWHHHPSGSYNVSVSPLALVHAANVLEQEEQTSAEYRPALDETYLAKAGLADELAAWREEAASLRQAA
jgi:HD-like signal output (HDOD) protein